eukprot:INCI17656.3.p1 GENE.INCI17656.3~~INCI17656.3.p1  ORF type:complete len:653 (+),score=129.44 INCI17656.3:280-2238(+)
MSGGAAPADFDENMQSFYVALAELQWDRSVVSLLNMQAVVDSQEASRANEAAQNDTTAESLECRKEILQACWAKVKAVALQQLQKFIDEDSPANAVVIWEKTKVLGFAEDASELYRNAFCGMVQTTAVNVMNRLQSTRALAGVAQVRSTLSNSLGDSEQSRKKYVAAVSELLNEGFAKVSAILAYGLRDDIDVSIALSVNNKIVPFVLQALQIFMEDRDVEAWRKQMQQDSQQKHVQDSRGSERELIPQDDEAVPHKHGADPTRRSDDDADREPVIDPAIQKSDLLLNEIAIMCQMCHHYTSSLLSSRLGPLLRDTKTSGKIFHELTATAQQLVGELIILESIFMARNIAVAASTVEPVPMDAAERVMCSSIVEELFYIVKKSFRRSIQSLNASAAAAIINQIVAAVDENVGSARFIRAFDCWLAAFGSAAQNEFERALSNALAGEERIPDEVFEGLNSLCVVGRELVGLKMLMEVQLGETFPQSPKALFEHPLSQLPVLQQDCTQALRTCLRRFHAKTLDAEVQSRLSTLFEKRRARAAARRSSGRTGGFSGMLANYTGGGSSAPSGVYVLDEETFVAMEATDPFAVGFVDGLRNTLCFRQCTSSLLRYVFAAVELNENENPASISFGVKSLLAFFMRCITTTPKARTLQR